MGVAGGAGWAEAGLDAASARATAVAAPIKVKAVGRIQVPSRRIKLERSGE